MGHKWPEQPRERPWGTELSTPPCHPSLLGQGSSSLLCLEGLREPGCSPLLADVVSLLLPRYNSAKKDNDFIYHEAVPALDTLQSVKGGDRQSHAVNPRGSETNGGASEICREKQC